MTSMETKCQHCGRTCKNERGLATHMGRQHPELVVRPTHVCKVPSCDRPTHPDGRGYSYPGYCTSHHVRVSRLGDAYEDVPVEPVGGKSLAQRRAELQA